ncbi:hypothetical protein SAMN04487762_0065 [Polaribacter sp. Hel1_33_78]|jgi:hypothetical protein|uniref:hypothetical protein n=1 Tax=Polaribacter sp. Hel1_33_78 TaxID=1336804 RepID=UPI00087C571B|nr:hypothetical protein [Polaribacter sp. Hel1_33_78]SDT86682.1 hypothetical protein SAMN04487762_0065 [Polaribacter sp. Hel1_33_78]
MELSKEQLLQIDNYIYGCGIKFHDVRAEIVDHFANILEKKLVKNSTIDFKKEIENIHSNFKDEGFKQLLKEKTKSVQKKFYKQSLQQVITFLKPPKIIITGVLFYVLFLLMNFVDDKEAFFSVLSFILIFLGFRLLFNVNMRNTKKDTFLVLNMTMYFFNGFYLSVMIFNFMTRNRNEESFLNPSYNAIELILFMTLLLFYWSGEYVFYQNKKLVKEQYPNVIL